MHEQLNLFYEIVNGKWFRRSLIVLCLNKRDLFEKKIKNGKSLRICFPDSDGEDGDVEYGIEYIKKQFLALNENQQRDVPVYITCNIDEKNVKKVFDEITKAVILYHSTCSMF